MLEFFKRKKTFVSWLVTYLLVIFVFLILLITIMHTSKTELRKSVLENNKSVFALLEYNVVEIKNSLDVLNFQVLLNKKVYNVLKNPHERNAQYYYNVKQIGLEMLSAVGPVEYISNCVIYDRYSSTIIDDGGIIDLKFRYDELNIAGYDYSEWKEFAEQRHAQYLYRTEAGDIVYANSIVGGTEQENVGTLFYVLNKEVLISKLGLNQEAESKLVIILNDEREPVFFSGVDDKNAMDISEQCGSYDEGIYDTVISTEEMVMFVSPYTNKLRLVYGVPKNELYSETNHVFQFLWIYVFGFIICSIVLSYLFSKWNYKPFEKLTRMIPEMSKLSDNPDEMENLFSNVKKLLVNNKQYEKVESEYNKIAFKQDFIKYIKGELYYSSVIEVFSRYGIAFRFSSYMVVLISIDELNDEIWPGIGDETELIELAVQNVYSEYLGDDISEITITLERDRILCLLGTNGDNLMEKVRDSFAKTAEFEQKHMGIVFTAFLSGTFDDLILLKDYYRSNLEIYLFSDRVENSVVLCQRVESNSLDSNNMQYFDADFMNFLKNGELAYAQSLLEQMFGENERNIDRSSFFKVKCTAFMIFTKLQSLVGDENSSRYTDLINEMMESDTLHLTKKRCLVIFHEMTEEYANSNNLHEQATLADEIADYVDKNYNNINLNVNFLGDVFHKTSRHISKVFKLKKGEFLRDYITHVRLKNAEILLSSNKKLEDIASECGFTNVNTFIRAFKQFYGETPGSMRTKG